MNRVFWILFLCLFLFSCQNVDQIVKKSQDNIDLILSEDEYSREHLASELASMDLLIQAASYFSDFTYGDETFMDYIYYSKLNDSDFNEGQKIKYIEKDNNGQETLVYEKALLEKNFNGSSEWFVSVKFMGSAFSVKIEYDSNGLPFNIKYLSPYSGAVEERVPWMFMEYKESIKFEDEKSVLANYRNQQKEHFNKIKNNYSSIKNTGTVDLETPAGSIKSDKYTDHKKDEGLSLEYYYSNKVPGKIVEIKTFFNDSLFSVLQLTEMEKKFKPGF